MIDGVVRAPSLFSITLVVLPSMIATHELVVPRSMPMIFAMFLSPENEFGWDRVVDNPGHFKRAAQLAALTVTNAGRSTRSAMR